VEDEGKSVDKLSASWVGSVGMMVEVLASIAMVRLRTNGESLTCSKTNGED